MEKSLIQIAYEFVSEQKQQVSFSKIWEYVVKESGMTPEEASKKAGQFFTNMMLDGRFVTLGENEWDLRSRHTFDKVHIDMKDVYSDVETSDDDEEEEAEEKLYNEVFEEAKEDDQAKNGDEASEEATENAPENDGTF